MLKSIFFFPTKCLSRFHLAKIVTAAVYLFFCLVCGKYKLSMRFTVVYLCGLFIVFLMCSHYVAFLYSLIGLSLFCSTTFFPYVLVISHSYS